MNNSKLVNVLRTFSKSEFKEFEKIAASPYFNRGRNYMPLLKVLKKFHPKFDDEKMTPEYIFSKLYPGKKVKKQVIWNLSSVLYNMVEEFLLQLSLKKHSFNRNQRIAEEFFIRKLHGPLAKKLEEMEKYLEQRGLSPDYFLFMKNLESGWKEYYYSQEKQLLIAEHDDREGEYSAHYFLWTILRVLNDIHIHSFMYNSKNNLNITHELVNNLNLEKIIGYCKKNNYKYTWLFEMYYNQIMITQTSDGEKYFLRLKELYGENYNKFTTEAKKDWMTCLVNYCGFRSDYRTRKTLFELHKIELKDGLAFDGKYMQKTYFLMVLKNAIAINETVWLKNFIEEFTPRLKPSLQKQMKAIGYAYLHLKNKDYGKIYETLGKIKFSDIKDKLTIKLIYLRAYYESNEIESLLSHIDTTWHFLSNNSGLIRADIAENHRNLLRIVKKLISIKESNEFYYLVEIKKSIEANPNLVLGEWLSKQVDEIKKGAD